MDEQKKFFDKFSIFLVAFITRLVYILTAAAHYKPIFDAGLYDDIARNLIDERCYCIHGSYSTLSRAPLWHWILSSVYYFTNKQIFFGQLFYCLLGSVTCIFIYLISKQLFTQRIAFFTGFITATYTGLFLYDGWLYSESLYTFCLTGFVYSLLRLQLRFRSQEGTEESDHAPLKGSTVLNRWAIGSSLFLAAAILARPNGSGLLLVMYLWIGVHIIMNMIKRQSWIHLLKQAFLITFIVAIIISPWSYRNYLISHRFVLVATGMGEVLVGAYNDNVLAQPPAQQGLWSPPKGTKSHDEVGYTPLNDDASTKQALAWITSHVNKLPLLFALHLENMWKPYSYSHGLPIEEFPQRLSSKIVFLLIPLQSIPIFILAFFDCVLTWKQQRKELLIVYLVLAFTLVENMLFYGTMRFRAPIEPLLVLLASDAFWKLCVCIKKYFPPYSDKSLAG